MSAGAEPNFCGCCGREIKWGTPEWCMDCIQAHIDTAAARPEDQTFFAQTGQECPFGEDSE